MNPLRLIPRDEAEHVLADVWFRVGATAGVLFSVLLWAGAWLANHRHPWLTGLTVVLVLAVGRGVARGTPPPGTPEP